MRLACWWLPQRLSLSPRLVRAIIKDLSRSNRPVAAAVFRTKLQSAFLQSAIPAVVSTLSREKFSSVLPKPSSTVHCCNEFPIALLPVTCPQHPPDVVESVALAAEPRAVVPSSGSATTAAACVPSPSAAPNRLQKVHRLTFFTSSVPANSTLSLSIQLRLTSFFLQRKKMPKASRPKFYAVRRGHRPGIYKSWPECSKQVGWTSGKTIEQQRS